MNKKYLLIAIFATVLFAIVAYPQESGGPELTVTLTPYKQHFILGEPIPLTFRVENRTDNDILLKTPFAFNNEKMIVDKKFGLAIEKPGGQIVETASRTGGYAYNRGLVIGMNPGSNIDERQVITNQLRDFFTEPGDYKLRAKLYILGSTTILSEWVTIKISKPVGKDATAYAFMRRVNDVDESSTAFPFHDPKNNEKFLRRFPDTIYADYARYQLAIYYAGDPQRRARASQLLKQIKGKTNFFNLNEIDRLMNDTSTTRPPRPSCN